MPVTVPRWTVALALIPVLVVLVVRFAYLRGPANHRLTVSVALLWLALLGKTRLVQDWVGELGGLSVLRVLIHLACMVSAVTLAAVARRARYGMHEVPSRLPVSVGVTVAAGVPMLIIALSSNGGQPETAGLWGVVYFGLFCAPIVYGLLVGLGALVAARREREGRGMATALALFFVAMAVDAISNVIAAIDRMVTEGGVAAAARDATSGSVFVLFVALAGGFAAVSAIATKGRGLPGADRTYLDHVRAMWGEVTDGHEDLRLLSQRDWWLLSTEELAMRLQVEVMDAWLRRYRSRPGRTQADAQSTASALALACKTGSAAPPLPCSGTAFQQIAATWPIGASAQTAR